MLKQNQTLLAQYPVRLVGGVFAAERTMLVPVQRQPIGPGITGNKAAVPSGHLAPSAWLLPVKPGGMASRSSAVGVSSMTGSGALGRALEAAITGAASLDVTGQLIVSAAADIAGVATVTGNVIAALLAAADLNASGNITGAMVAIGSAAASLAGSATATVTIRASGSLAADIEVGAVGVLTAPGIASELLDEQLVETGLTVRDTLRLCVAALAGKIAGSGSSTITINNALVDNKTRITATVDGSGNRTALTYDLSD